VLVLVLALAASFPLVAALLGFLAAARFPPDLLTLPLPLHLIGRPAFASRQVRLLPDVLLPVCPEGIFQVHNWCFRSTASAQACALLLKL
jgi:hypothetical protein